MMMMVGRMRSRVRRCHQTAATEIESEDNVIMLGNHITITSRMAEVVAHPDDV